MVKTREPGNLEKGGCRPLKNLQSFFRFLLLHVVPSLSMTNASSECVCVERLVEIDSFSVTVFSTYLVRYPWKVGFPVFGKKTIILARVEHGKDTFQGYITAVVLILL